eukprot:gnl/Spiro4/7321_TR3835_c0_g1_i1.p1 gnl/Spiro4/7321_TR3835_c0_g1~~gnl/Spiro4/7321_TR3835_c0_g1_i1.p1  ORF type:complete len:355 (+),score=106.10 gnl/Spiro4/7321_TR3835_c0_g1_i1:77-1066(+)
MDPAPGVHLKDYKTKYFVLVMCGAVVYAFAGGFINAMCIAGVYRTGLTHLTGSTTFSAVRLINPTTNNFNTAPLLLFILGFGIGALLTGLLVGPPRMWWGGLQGFCMLLQASNLLIGYYLAPTQWGAFFVSIAMGVHNSTTSLFQFQIPLRTSHVSGAILDIGLTIGQSIHMREPVNVWRLGVHVPIFSGFWIGAVMGTVSFNAYAGDTLLFVIIFYAIGGLTTLLWVAYKKWIVKAATPPAPSEDEVAMFKDALAASNKRVAELIAEQKARDAAGAAAGTGVLDGQVVNKEDEMTLLKTSAAETVSTPATPFSTAAPSGSLYDGSIYR